MEIDRSKRLSDVIVIKDGYEARYFSLAPQVESASWANFLNLGVGFIVDYATGSLIKYEPEYYIPLAKK